VGETQLS